MRRTASGARPPRVAAGAIALVALLLALAPTSSRGSPSGGTPVDRRLFEPGSCISFPPTSARDLATVFIDAGHGGPDPGAVGVTPTGASVHEADETVRVALDVLPLLRSAGFRVVLSRTGAAAVVRPRPGDLSGPLFTGLGVHRDLVARDECANRAGASILVGLYFNAAASASAAGSVTLYDAARPFWRSSLLLSTLLQRDVLARLNAHHWAIPDDGVHTDVGYGSALSTTDRSYHHLLLLGPGRAGYLSSPSEMPGSLIEPLFLTDPFEATIAASPVGQSAIARGLAAAVEQYAAQSPAHA